ncbi:MAG TPA: MFS transporter [Gammaproteobacteria bacterium]|nr:MFS transporter [Gammaproteobacteria bacterium]
METRSSVKLGLIPWFVCALGALFYSYEYLLRMSPSVMAENLMRFYHLTGAQFGYLSGSYYYYSYVAMQILVGVMMDRFGPRRLLTFACFLCAVGAYLFACSDYIVVAMIGRFLVGLGSAFAFVGAAKLATIWLQPRYFALMSGIIFCLGMLGAAFGDIVLRVIVDSAGWQTAMIAAAIGGVVLSVIIWAVVRDRNPYYENQYLLHTTDMSSVLSGLKQALLNRQIWLCGIVGCLLYLFLSAFAELWGPAYLAQAHGIDRVHAANANSMVFIGCAMGAPLWGLFSDFLELRRIPIIFASLAAMIVFCILLYVQSLSLISIYILLFLFGFFSSVQILVFAIAREVTSIKISGTAIGLVNMLVMIGGIVFPPAIGKILDLNWVGTMVDGARIYSAHAYVLALSLLPLGILVGILATLCLRETHCEIHMEDEQHRASTG